jgi:DNA-binding MarR family transcriptional regulator
MNEFHTIDVIGNRTLPMNELADDLSVTMGTATVAIENLVKKNFVKRERIQEDRRRVFVSLTKKGLLALENHRTFHKKMINLVTKDLSTNELENFTGIFDKLHQNLSEALINSQPQKICDFNENIELKITDVLGTRGIRDFFFNQNIKVGTVLKILKKSNNTIFLLVENKEIELDKKDTYNLIAIPNL